MLPNLFRAGQVGMGCQRTPWPWIEPQKALPWGDHHRQMPILPILAAKGGVRLVKSKLGYSVHPIVLVRSVGMAQEWPTDEQSATTEERNAMTTRAKAEARKARAIEREKGA